MPLTKDNSMDYYGNENPVCPKCDHVIDIADNELWSLYSDELHEIPCPECNEKIQVISEATWKFRTDEQEDF